MGFRGLDLAEAELQRLDARPRQEKVHGLRVLGEFDAEAVTGSLRLH